VKRAVMAGVLAAMLAGCGGSDQETSDSEQSPAPTPTQEAAASSTPEAGEDIVENAQQYTVAMQLPDAVQEYCVETASGDSPKLRKELRARIVQWSAARALMTRAPNGEQLLRDLDKAGKEASETFDFAANAVEAQTGQRVECAPDLKRQLDTLREAAAG
jgi:hypothetical protein